MAGKKYEATVDGLIQCLLDIKAKCGGNIPVQINVLGSPNPIGLHAVCCDNDTGNDKALVYLEATPESDVKCPVHFNLYSQGEEI